MTGQDLEAAILHILDTQWSPEHGLASEAIFDQLVSEGMEIPSGEMDRVLKRLEANGVIRAVGHANTQDEVETHGGIAVIDYRPNGR